MPNVNMILYNNASAPNVVHKRLTTLDTLTGDILENVDREKVVLTIPDNSHYAVINYAYIDVFSRYYFVEVEKLTGGLLKLTMKSDALSSFWANYKQSNCIAKRSTNNYNPALKDDLIPFKAVPKYERRVSNFGFTPSSSGGCYILTVGGK